ncbi:MAG: hypothetical protein WA906_13815 [Pacificimonas sp.]
MKAKLPQSAIRADERRRAARLARADLRATVDEIGYRIRPDVVVKRKMAEIKRGAFDRSAELLEEGRQLAARHPQIVGAASASLAVIGVNRSDHKGSAKPDGLEYAIGFTGAAIALFGTYQIAKRDKTLEKDSP